MLFGLFTSVLAEVSLTQLRNDFDSVAVKLPLCYSDNETGSIAWGTSSHLLAYIRMYEATGARKYLDYFIKIADEVISKRDDNAGKQDYCGNSLPLWGTSGKYTLAETCINNSMNEPIVKIKSVLHHHNHLTIIEINTRDSDSCFDMFVSNPTVKKKEEYRNLALFPTNAEDLFVNRINSQSKIIKIEPLKKEFSPRDLLLSGRFECQPQRMCFLVQTGVIVYPLLKFVEIVRSDKALLSDNGLMNKSVQYLESATQSLMSHESEYREDNNCGWYVFPKGSPFWCDGAVVPHNYYAAVGKCFVVLYRITKEEQYRVRTEKLANNLKRNLKYLPENDLYVWHYWWGNGFYGWTETDNISVNTRSFLGTQVWEDVSHAQIDIGFIYETCQSNIVFNKTDLQRIANTLVKNVFLSDSDKDINGWVGGSNRKAKKYGITSLCGWVFLTQYDSQIYPKIRKIYDNKSLPLLIIANLALYCP